ncbi:MAG: phospholipid/cholesterol/gamma-HCH transport system substrate-binding protein [Thermoleophilaceae bacterium]|nr:phospholipid/cholesterol/gamma-HCH transport system substrate-binding protein [Thermoleophilaceae bacterium]
MQKRAPSLAQIAIMVVFALSCFLILTYIWKSFGGPSPLAAKGYRVQANFEEATQLADTADVRISGVTVGRVVKTEETAGRTHVTMQIERRYAPISRASRAILRQKTLLGETYVELAPGSRTAGLVPDNGTLPNRQVAATTELDEITRALDSRTRTDLQRLVGSLAGGLAGRGQDINDALGNLPPFADDSTQLLRTLDVQHRAVRRLVRDTGVVFGALGRRQGELSALVRAGDRVLATTAARDRDLADTVRILPTTLAELRPTLVDLRGLTADAGPVVHDLRPGARALAPALRDAAVLAPELQGTFRDVDKLVTASREGVPATTRIVHAARPLFDVLVPVLQNAQPIVDYLGLFKGELVSQISSVAASFQGSEPQGAGGPSLHFLRALVPLSGEASVTQTQRYGSNRHNPYPVPGFMNRLKTFEQAIDCRNVGNTPAPDATPPCEVQKPFTFRGKARQFHRLVPDR